MPGSVAAPTAGLHFTRRLCHTLEKSGIGFAEITLHVGLATFCPIRVKDISLHTLLPERYAISEEASRKINDAKQEGRRVIAVGTTVVRCLEYAIHSCGKILPHQGWATLYILPGYSFQAIDAIITNFHLPRTSLLILVSSFAGRETILHAYQEAIREGYRFYSYGDAMLIQ
jgi:S-adenosylmethionine:tRNA ribosyltransferase-isomerase